MTRVKICGITSLEDARMAVQAGADALGFIFVENTPRFVTPEQVAPIIRALPPFVTAVGIFWDHPAGHIKAIIEACGLRVVQFHGDETPEDCQGYSVPVIKTIKLPPVSTIDGLPEYRVTERFGALLYRKVVAAYLLDSQARWSEGEGREPLEWRSIRLMADKSPRESQLPIVLSGGLTPENVATAVSIVRPFAVDVNSGVEARLGKKDAEKVRRFIEAAKRA